MIKSPLPCQNPCQYTEWSTWGSWGKSTPSCLDAQNEKASMSTNDQSYPQNGFAFFNARDEFGEIEQGQSQCFRVFETAESFANVDSIIKARLTEAQSVFGNIGTLVSNGDVAKLRELKYALAFIEEWIRDGLYTTADSG